MINWIIAGFVFGFLGSFHCIGMCGPLAMALPGSGRPSPKFIMTRLIYNFGRIITYTLLGALIGLFSGMISISGYQQFLSIGIGLLLILMTGFTTLRDKLNHWKSYPLKWIRKASDPVKKLFSQNNPFSLLAIGLLNGFLPCGFVYLALATSTTSGSAENGLLFMAGFGMGTVPAMLGVSMAGKLLSVSLREKMAGLSPYFIGFVGVLLILRGLGLGIPFFSPHY